MSKGNSAGKDGKIESLGKAPSKDESAGQKEFAIPAHPHESAQREAREHISDKDSAKKNPEPKDAHDQDDFVKETCGDSFLKKAGNALPFVVGLPLATIFATFWKLFGDRNFPFLANISVLLAILTLLAATALSFATRFPKSKRRIWLSFLIFSAFAGIFVFLTKPQKVASTEPIRVTNLVEKLVPVPDYIRGTKFTHSRLYEALPFGWGVFRILDDGTPHESLKYEPDPKGLLKISWDNLHIVPDFATRQVAFEFEGLNVKSADGAVDLIGITAVERFPISLDGIAEIRSIQNAPGKPWIFCGTLSDDQRSPVFVIGVRIPGP